jgi:hypothetical protein
MCLCILEPQANDGWNNVIPNSPPRFNGWPTVSLPLPPPLHLEQPVQQIASVASQVHSTHIPKKFKALTLEPEPSKGK